ncbi:L,D-transpeptidase family protein [Paracoccus sediminicola]|uniref:L,D-transpeptidase family protein n=1 Tax=Paracoccus sediminicola TaxID=3017783 RepID=UPI0022F0E41F|nr:L,D-transpeptidase family protein [Paracoccus sediminicola]WBU55998.1 L,D-transpeptidase family protein [Paracoccus sediminicola]
MKWRRTALLRLTFLLTLLCLGWLIFAPLWDPPRTPDAPDITGPLPGPEPAATGSQKPLQGRIDRIVIEKAARRLSVFQGESLVREYRIGLGFAPEGDKERQGDGRTPEGVFRVDRLNDRSKYHLSIGLDYPLPEDRARAAAGGYDPGGDIFIHGQPNQIEKGYRVPGDWTAGCIAIDNHQIAELFAATRIGTEVEIRP